MTAGPKAPTIRTGRGKLEVEPASDPRYFRIVATDLADATANGLIGSAAGITGAHSIPISRPIESSVLVAGVEIAAVASSDDRAMRAAHRGRRGQSATPLLLLGDAEEPGSIVTLLDHGGPLRRIPASDLLALLHHIAPMRPLQAIRYVAEALDRLDRADTAGLLVHGLLTRHLLNVRFRGDTHRWPTARALVHGLPPAPDWRALLQFLGYTVDQLPQRGYVARHDGAPVAVIHPKKDASQFAVIDAQGHPPEGVLLNQCRAQGARFGLLASGTRVRLFDSDPAVGSAASRYLELDAATLAADDRPFLALLSPGYLASGGFAGLEEEARHFGTQLRRTLDADIRQTVLPQLGVAMGTWAVAEGRDTTADDVREDLERATLTLMFRLLFVLYAESAGYLPVDSNTYAAHALTSLVREAHETRDRLSSDATTLWDRVTTLVHAIRSGNEAWGVAAYNGDLFAASGFDGAKTLERLQLPDPVMASVLVGLGWDTSQGSGVDFSTMDVDNLGHIYEGLLSLRLAAADSALRYDAADDKYVPEADTAKAEVSPGDLVWLTNAGGRKAGGVYYTPESLVRHLVRQSVVPAFERHLSRVADVAVTDPGAAATMLLDFAVLDPSCGSAHFLVAVLNELADMTVTFLGTTPLPKVQSAIDRMRAGAAPGSDVDDVALLRRLLLKRCIHGVDLSPMGVEIAKVSLWLASFVPGVSLAYLDRNIVCGNALIGVASAEALRATAKRGKGKGTLLMVARLVDGPMRDAAEAARRVADVDDLTPEEYRASRAADREARTQARNLEALFDIWTAEPLGLPDARGALDYGAADVLSGATTVAMANELPLDVGEAQRICRENQVLHWPTAFPVVFQRENPGFDVVVGNPPWEEITVEALAFLALYRPGIRSLPQAEREAATDELLRDRPDVAAQLVRAQQQLEAQRRYVRESGELPPMPGDPDLYKLFCLRYQLLLRGGGALGVVLPRSVLITAGSAAFRSWLFERITTQRIDTLLNGRSWMFDSHPQYSVALVAARNQTPPESHVLTFAGTAASEREWEQQVAGDGVPLASAAFGPAWTVPLLRNAAEAGVLAQMRSGPRFPLGSSDRWRAFAVAELHETNDKTLWADATQGWPLWKGESFDQYAPHGAGARICPPSEAAMVKVAKSNPGKESLIAKEFDLAARQRAQRAELDHARVVFRDVTNRLNFRTAIGCLAPRNTFLANSAPYLVFLTGDDSCRAACLGIINSLPFDWQTRRFVERHLNFFILEGLTIPDLDDYSLHIVATAAARLSCTDERFASFAAACKVSCGPLDETARADLRCDIDAHVAHAWGLTVDDLDVILADFTEDAVTPSYRSLLRERLHSLS